jgi:YesN/AraC family two-component response regulator
MLNVLYIDDEPINLSIFELSFKKDFNIVTSESPVEALTIFDSQNIDIVITDLKMPYMDGIELIREIKKRSPQKKCILLTAYYEPKLLNDPEIKSIVFQCVMKPFRKLELKELILSACA